MQLQAGQNVDVICPSKYVYGESSKYSHFGSMTIPANTDLIIHFEVEDCEENVKNIKKVMKTKNHKEPKMYKAIEKHDKLIGSANDVDETDVIEEAKKEVEQAKVEVQKTEKILKKEKKKL